MNDHRGMFYQNGFLKVGFRFIAGLVIFFIVAIGWGVYKYYKFSFSWTAAAHMPRGAMVYCETSSLIPLVAAFKKTRFYHKWRNIKEISTLHSAPFGGDPINDTIKPSSFDEEENRVKSDWLLRMLQWLPPRPLAIALYSWGDHVASPVKLAEAASEQKFLDTMDVLLATPDQMNAWSRIRRYLDERSRSREEMVYRGQTFEAYELPEGTLFLAHIKGEVWMAAQKERLQQVFDTILDRLPSLAQEANFSFLKNTVKKKTNKHDSLQSALFLLFDPKQFTDVLDEMLKDPGRHEGLDKFYAFWRTLTAITVTVSFEPPHWRMDFVSHYSPTGDHFNETFLCPPNEHTEIQMVPASVILYQLNHCMDWVSLVESLMRTFGTKQLEGKPFGIAFQDTWLHKGRDFFERCIGSDFGIFVTGVQPAIPFPIPKLSFFVSLKEPKTFEAWVSEAASAVPWLKPHVVFYNGRSLTQWGSFLGFEPSTVLLNDHWVVSTLTKELKQILDVLEGRVPSLSSDEEAVSIIPSLNPRSRVSSVMFVRPPQWVPLLHQAVRFLMGRSLKQDAKRRAFIAGMKERLRDLQQQKERLLSQNALPSETIGGMQDSYQSQENTHPSKEESVKEIDEKIQQIETTLEQLHSREQHETALREAGEKKLNAYMDLGLTIPVVGVTSRADHQQNRFVVTIDWSWP